MSIIPLPNQRFALLIASGQCSGMWIGKDILMDEPKLSQSPWFFTEQEKKQAVEIYTEKFAAQSVIVVQRTETIYPNQIARLRD